jgi:hypothetical protein
MPVIVTVLLGGMLVSVLFLGALASSDQSTRRLILGIVLFSTVATLLLFLWLAGRAADHQRPDDRAPLT